MIIGNEVFLNNVKRGSVPDFCRKGIPYLRGGVNEGFVVEVCTT